MARGVRSSRANSLDRVGVRLHVHERRVAACLVEFVHVSALQVLDLSLVRKKLSTTYTTAFSERCGIVIYN